MNNEQFIDKIKNDKFLIHESNRLIYNSLMLETKLSKELKIVVLSRIYNISISLLNHLLDKTDFKDNTTSYNYYILKSDLDENLGILSFIFNLWYNERQEFKTKIFCECLIDIKNIVLSMALSFGETNLTAFKKLPSNIDMQIEEVLKEIRKKDLHMYESVGLQKRNFLKKVSKPKITKNQKILNFGTKKEKVKKENVKKSISESLLVRLKKGSGI